MRLNSVYCKSRGCFRGICGGGRRGGGRNSVGWLVGFKLTLTHKIAHCIRFGYVLSSHYQLV